MKVDHIFALENAGWPALLLDSTSAICRANQAAIKLFGPVLEASSPSLSAVWSPENGSTAEQFLAHWERSPSPLVPLRFRSKGGQTVALPTFICAFSRDGAKYFALQMVPDTAPTADGASIHKQKLDCALQLARTVALDFNNTLTSILGHASFALSQMEPGHPLRASLLEVEKAAGRAAEIASDLGAFSRQEKEARPQQSAGNLNQVVQRAADLFQRNPDHSRISWGLELERHLFATKFDEAKLQQALAKILENAVEALEKQGQPRITVKTTNIELTSPAQDRNVRLAPGAHVCIEISDNGSGIAPEARPHLFEPFFSTKRNHRGLGLVWVYGVVTNHGGGVCISGEPGAGASVRIYLPAERKIVEDKSIDDKDLKGTGTILLVDDEQLILTLGQMVLSGYGYRVLTAGSGQKALELLKRNDPAPDLLVTDMVMPGMSGRELMEQVQRLSPGLPILRMSGYVSSAPHQDAGGYLQKPFSARDLVLKVKQALNLQKSS